jgi:phosphotransacetylase
MGLPGFDELRSRADARADRVPVVVAGGDEPTVLDMLAEAERRGWVRPIVAGPAEALARLRDERGIDPDRLAILDAERPAEAAVAAVRSGRAAILLKGRVATPDLVRAILDPDAGLRTPELIAQVVLMEIPRDGRRFLLADTGIIPEPDPSQMLGIVRHVVRTAHALGEPRPRVALMAASETVSDRMPETGRAAALAESIRGGAVPGCLAQGPLSFDLAYEADAGAKKRVGGDVIGAADAMVFPDLLSANLTVKAIMYTADCRFGGVLRGTSRPVAFMSRADRVETRLNSLAMALALLDAGDVSPHRPAEA